ncbi:MAG: hypothetical protein EA406_12605 [Rhodospirillales bacterium]|nr:MAG: hypothetical protein EA406_12605 [Rhodospirillales bacterium]
MALGFFNVFGRSRDLQRFDAALREAGLHPRLLPEAVKLTALKLMRNHACNVSDAATCQRAADLLVYCAHGRPVFGETNPEAAVAAVEARLAAAIDAGDSLDAQLVLLGLNAGIVHPSVIEAFGLEVGAP